MCKTKVHKHLPTNRWSITQKGVVVGYADTCTMEHVHTHMNLNIKAKHSHKRTVHCWTLGTLTGVTGFTPLKGRTLEVSDSTIAGKGTRKVRYNPFRDDYLNYADDQSEYTGSELATYLEDGLMLVNH